MKIQISGPQFERTDKLAVYEDAAPQGVEWETLDTWPTSRLKALGCKLWDEGTTHELWLFPEQWYLFIPEGFVVTFIDGTSEPFKPGVTDDDIRFGCLPFGVNIHKEQS